MGRGQHRTSAEPDCEIVNDPNRKEDPKYILRLIGQVITVSLEAQKIVQGLPWLELDGVAINVPAAV